MKPALVFGLFAALTTVSLYAEVVEVTPSNMGNWSFITLDNTGAVCSGPVGCGSGGMVTGPATPPLGTGSANLQTGVGYGDDGTGIGTSDFNSMALSALTTLSYWTYDTVNNGQQFPYLALNISFTNDINNDGPGTDTLFFEPPYQQPSTGNPSLPDQGASTQNLWQEWNALAGGWWDNNGFANPGTGVQSLAAIAADFTDPVITANPFFSPDGLELQVGFGSPGETENGNVDAVTVNGTTYDFDPDAPEPGTFFLLGGGLFAGLLIYKRRNKLAAVGSGN
jgi:hypothetical protein